MDKEVEEKDKKNIDSRRFRGWLILNWNNGDMRVLKNKPKNNQLTPYDITVEVDITLNVPRNPPSIKAKGEFDIPQTKVKDIFLEDI